LDSLGKRRIITAGLVLALALSARQPRAASQDLHAQSAAAVLEREFAGPDLSYLLLDGDGRLTAQHWETPDAEIPVGSLLKPFMAVAYGRTHRSFPIFRCTGGKTCWLPRGHGTLHVREAIAFSCNSYFHQLVARGGPPVRTAMAGFALNSAGHEDEAQSLTDASPLALARAYLELMRHAHEAAVIPVLQGLALSAKQGTAKAVDARLNGMTALAKTGTAACTHKKKAPGDGFALVIFPAENPRAVLLVRLHGRPGYMAAAVAGRMIAKVEAGAEQ
jgi:hypothetical protein